MIKKLNSAAPALKTNNALRWVSRIIATLGYILFVIGILNNVNDFLLMGGAVLIFLCMAISGVVIGINENRLFEYASNMPITSLPKPAYDPKFWKKRKKSALLLMGSLFLLGFGYTMFTASSLVGVVSVIISVALLICHIIEHPQRETVFSPANMR